MLWSNYIQDFASREEFSYASLKLSFPEISYFGPTFFVRLNQNLLNDFYIYDQDQYVFVYPNSKHFIISLLVFKTIRDVLTGDVTGVFDPYKFKKGDRFRFCDAIGIFECIEKGNDGITRFLFSRLGDGQDRMGLPIEKLAPLELANDDVKLSTRKKFDEEYKKYSKLCFCKKTLANNDEDLMINVAKNRALQSSGIILVTKINYATNVLQHSTIGNKPLLDCISVSVLSSNGAEKSLCNGISNPEIILAPNVNSVVSYLQKGRSISAVFFDLERINCLVDDVDALQIIGSQDKDGRRPSLIFFCPNNNSFDLSFFLDRGVPVFRWTNALVNDDLVYRNLQVGSKILFNFANQKIRSITCHSDFLEDAHKQLNNCQTEIQDEQMPLINAYSNLWKALMYATRCLILPSDAILDGMTIPVGQIMDSLRDPKIRHYMSRPELMDELFNVWDDIQLFFAGKSPKEEILFDELLSKPNYRNKKIALVVTEEQLSPTILGRIDDQIFIRNIKGINIRPCDIFTPETFAESEGGYDIVIICGWMKKDIMKKIIFSNLSREYVPFLYPFETQWMANSVNLWKEEIEESHINEFNAEIDDPGTKPINIQLDTDLDLQSTEDLESIIAKSNDTRIRGLSSNNNNESTKYARYISFNDGSYGAYTEGYSFTSVRDLEDEDEASATEKSASELSIGDVILMFDSSKDVIKELAERILKRNGDSDCITTAALWKSSFVSARLRGLDDEAILLKLKMAGIKRSVPEFRLWLDESSPIICPRGLDTVMKIAQAMDDQLLLESAEEVTRAATLVRASRIKAGRKLVKSLFSDPEILKKVQETSKSNESFFTTQKVVLPSIGDVFVLRVTDLGDFALFPSSQVNGRLH